MSARAAAVFVICGIATGNCGGGSPAPTNSPPQAGTISVSPNATGMAGVTPFRFAAQGAQDPDGNSLTYSWNFGDGSTDSSATPTHTYANGGTFTVSLTVSDGRQSATASSVTVSVGPNLSANWSHSQAPGAECSPQPPCFPHRILRLTITQSGEQLSGGLTPNVDFVPTGLIEFPFTGSVGVSHPAAVRFSTGDVAVAAINNDTLSYSFEGETSTTGTTIIGTLTQVRKMAPGPLCNGFPGQICPTASIITQATLTRQ